MTTKQCDANGDCYYTFTDAWHVWGRWVLLGALIVVIIAAIPFCGYLMSVKRMRKGLAPVSGCAWMFPNPYKNAAKAEDQQNLPQNEQRYRARTEIDAYREQKGENFERDGSGGSLSEDFSYPSSHDKYEQA